MSRIPIARRLRRDMTDAERKLWPRLRNRQLRGLKFRRQMPIGGFIADFACVEAGLVIEVDGSKALKFQLTHVTGGVTRMRVNVGHQNCRIVPDTEHPGNRPHLKQQLIANLKITVGDGGVFKM